MDSEIMGGQPCVRGIRIPVSLIIKLLAAGKIVEEILDDYPELEREDVKQALEYAAWTVSDLDYEGHQKAVISYSWLTDEEMAERVGGVLEGCCSVAGLCFDCCEVVLRRCGVGEMRRLWYSVRVLLRCARSEQQFIGREV